MSTLPEVGLVLLGLLGGAAITLLVRRARAKPRRAVRRILLPFTGTAISRRAVDAAIRLALAEDATLVPAYVASVPLTRPLDAPMPLECETALPMLEAVEQRALRRGVEVDSRIESGRSPRDALQRLLEVEDFDRIVVPASYRSEAGFSPEDVAWILDRVPGEVVVFRGSPEDQHVIAGAAVPERA